MKKVLINIFAIYFTCIGLSSLWGAHVHHLDNGTVKTEEPTHRAVIATVGKEFQDFLKETTHCVSHCTIESLLGHILENKTSFGLDKVGLVSPKNEKKQYLKISITKKLFKKSLFFEKIKSTSKLFTYFKVSNLAPRAPPIR